MRLNLLALVVALAARAWAESDEEEEREPEPQPTIFNSVTVPPPFELTPTNWEHEVKKTKWLIVKHYSPYCPHCIDFLPVYQTAYEFYHTSKSPDGKPFADEYDFRFAVINCVAHSEFCEDHNVKSWPTTVIYKDGEVFKSLKGNRDMSKLSAFIEEALETAKPGSRPKDLALPAPGDKESPKPAQKPADDKPADKKPANDKSADKKPADKKPADKKPADKKPADKKPADDKPADKKPADKKPALDKDKAPKDGAKAPTPSDKPADKTPPTPASTANPKGISVSLTKESFQDLVTRTQDPWFIKFYVPWCHHCQALAPTWEQLAKSMQGRLNVAEVNCEKGKQEAALCRDVNVRGYPTVLFFKGAERAEYTGLRGLGDFVQYAEKAMDLASGVPDVDAASFKQLEQKEDVIFVYFYDHATTSEDFQALERLPLSLIGHAKLVKTKDPKLFDRFKITTWPRLVVSREGRPTYYPPLTPDEMRDVRGVLDWMRSVWLPLVPELSPSNARQVMDGKIVVLGILNHDDHDAFHGSLREMKSAANEWMDRQIQEFQLERKKLRDSKQMRIEEAEDRDDQRALRAAKAIRVNMDTSGRKEVMFAWVDGVYWQRWIRTTYGVDVKDGERIIINDEDNRRYWDNTVTGNYILVSRTSIMETLDKIVYGPNVIKYKLTVSAPEKLLFDIRVAFSEHPFLSFGCVAGIGFGIFSWLRGRNRRRGGHFRLDDSMGIRELKDGLMGVNGNQKAD